MDTDWAKLLTILLTDGDFPFLAFWVKTNRVDKVFTEEVNAHVEDLPSSRLIPRPTPIGISMPQSIAY